MYLWVHFDPMLHIGKKAGISIQVLISLEKKGHILEFKHIFLHIKNGEMTKKKKA